jgi:sugar lactone lactonase YvrE
MVVAALGAAVSACSDSSRPDRPPDTRVPEYHDEWEMNIWAFTVDEKGILHVVQFADPEILKYSSQGDFLGSSFVVVDGDTVNPSGLTYVKEHIVALAWSHVIVVNEEDSVVKSWPERHPRNVTAGGDLIDADASGNIYVLDDNYNRVAKYGLDGSFKHEWNIEPVDSITDAWVSGIAVSDRGQVYVTQPGRNRILMYSEEGRPLKKFGAHGSGPNKFAWPLGIDVSNGTLYVADSANIRVTKFTLYGEYLSNFYSLGTYGGEIDAPRSVAVYKNNVFVMHDRSIMRFVYSD